jgi:type I site-specific restriction endonuclease
MGRKKFKKNGGSNEYKIGELDLQEILGLNNKELISKAASEYANWMATEKLKKEDPKLSAIQARIKELEDDIKQSEDYQKIKEKLDEKFEELADESLAGFKEEKKNLMEPYKEDVNRFRGTFKAAMDEINRRKLEGKLVVEGKII